jgi:nicotinate-nucleotide--dimethylbenzimidazole phosphoribosyltransferase
MSLLEDTLVAIRGADAAARDAAARRQARLTKPPGSLGALERLAVQLAGITGLERPRFQRRVVVVAAASHGVAREESVSAYPASVTAQMVANFAAGGAALNVLADAAGAELVLVDAGVEPEPPPHPRLRRCRLAPGSRNLRRERALPAGHGRRIVEAGIALVDELDTDRPWLLALGEMGIGNTTPSAAIVAAACGAEVEAVVGRGTLVDDAGLAAKRAVVREALDRHRPDPGDGLDLLESVGGYEIGFLAGCCLAGAARRVPVVLDGLITAAAALVATALAPACRDALVAGHRSVEPGHRVALEALRLEPLLDLELRLGEGSGAALALPLVAAAARTLDEMATFDEAGVDDRE